MSAVFLLYIGRKMPWKKFKKPVDIFINMWYTVIRIKEGTRWNRVQVKAYDVGRI